MVESVSDDEAVGDLEADVVNWQVDLASEAGSRARRVRSRYDSVSPESTMSSTIRTSRFSIGASRSLRMRTTPLESVEEP